MNEISILLHLLSKKEDLDEIGATEKEIAEILNLKNRNKKIHFQNLIIELSQIIEPIGLLIQYNPLNSHWFIIFKSEISDLIKSNPFKNKPSLAATLFCILASCLKNSGFTTIHEIQALRIKKTISDDIKELEKEGYIKYNKELNQITLTPLIGYQLDMNKLVIKLLLKLKDENEN